MLPIWGIPSTPSLPLFPSPLRPRVVAPYRVLFKGQIEQNCVFMLNQIFEMELFLTLKLYLS